MLLSTVSSDAHTWNLVFLQLLLEESGHEVINLGPCVPDQLLVDMARRLRPDAIVLSSVNGHGHLDGARVIRALRTDPVTRHIPAIIGGKLGIGGSANALHSDALIEAGFDAVFHDDGDVDGLRRYLTALPGGRPALAPAHAGEVSTEGANAA
ncbi:MAG: hypothetical protein AUI10_07065 [Actinobacteria bacterium 13_2_20CM_2_72_6]|nr:MAG: hypothetical protein AUI10_07065 [Actinobacteria bacterium 13_2_20CM_2_72_6]